MNLDKPGYIYFITSEKQESVKIGFAADVYMRHKSLQTGNPDELTIMAKIPATLGAERLLHHLLKPYRIRLEWYPDNDLTFFLLNELQDEVMDRAIEWLGENMPDETNPDEIGWAMDQQLITATEMAAIVNAHLREWNEEGRITQAQACSG